MQHVPEVLETFNRLQWIQVFLQIKMNEENEITQVNKNCLLTMQPKYCRGKINKIGKIQIK